MKTTASGVAILRVTVGVIFLLHGSQKLFTYGIANVTSMMAHFSIPLPAVAAVVVTIVEFGAGIALIVGIVTRWAALLLAIEMAVVIFALKLKTGFFAPKGFEYEFLLLAACIVLVLTGSGAFALDNFLFRNSPIHNRL